MSDQDVKEGLGRYADWLQRSSGLSLSPSCDALWPMESNASSEPRRNRWIVLIAAAAAIVAIGTALMFRPDSSRFVVAAASLDPVGPLYVLPTPLSPGAIGTAQVIEDSEPAVGAGTEILIVGRSTGADSYTDLATIWVGTSEGLGLGIGENPKPLGLATGPAEVSDDFFTVLVQNREGTTIKVITDGDRVEYAGNIVDNLTIDSTGSASIETSSEFEVIEAATFGNDAKNTSTYFDIVSPLTTDRGSITVETATSPSPLLGAGAPGGRLSATRIFGAEGWTLSRLDADGEWNGIAWQATPSRMIAVSGHAPLAAIRAVAESMVIVSEDEWKTAIPNYTTA